jgi:hypothetical protein
MVLLYFLVLVISFIYITHDIIGDQITFNDSYFKKYAGNWYIDPMLSWKNKNFSMWLYPVLSMFGDLFHLTGTVVLTGYMSLVYFSFKLFDYGTSYFEFIIICFLFHSLGSWVGKWLWRNWLNIKKDNI